MLAIVDYIKVSIQQQEALLVEAKKEADHKAQIIALLSKEDAARFFALKNAEAKRETGSQSSIGRNAPKASSSEERQGQEIFLPGKRWKQQ